MTGLREWIRKHGPANKGKHLSEETKRKLSVSLKGRQFPERSGPNHPNWKGGLRPLRKDIAETSMYRHWRRSVFERDNYTCQHCKIRGIRLNADHIRPFSHIIKE